jgi:bifunctional UDP-N-acetylglucosamine pyrophosphorylase/glucosamine-1-phosphate N-acetyltransferase
LKKFISNLKPDNVQREIYITDLIKIFNDNGLRVCSSGVTNNNLVIAFNVKSVLKRMEETFREIVYGRLKDIITIDDSDDFFIAEDTIDRILKLDKQHRALEIQIGKGAYVGPNVEVKRGLRIGRNAILKGKIRVGENVKIDEASTFSTFPEQTIDIGENSHIFRGSVIQGSVKIGKNVRVETGVRITGSTEEPVVIGDNVQIKGMTYIFGSVIEDDLLIEHSILKNKLVEKVIKKDGEVQPIKYILPHPEGLDSITNLEKDKRQLKTDR